MKRIKRARKDAFTSLCTLPATCNGDLENLDGTDVVVSISPFLSFLFYLITFPVTLQTFFRLSPALVRFMIMKQAPLAAIGCRNVTGSQLTSSGSSCKNASKAGKYNGYGKKNLIKETHKQQDIYRIILVSNFLKHRFLRLWMISPVRKRNNFLAT